MVGRIYFDKSEVTQKVISKLPCTIPNVDLTFPNVGATIDAGSEMDRRYEGAFVLAPVERNTDFENRSRKSAGVLSFLGP